MNELQINAEKFPDKLPSQLIKILFHGSGKNGAEPKTIYESDEGLDIRFANFGMFGQGVYFADNSKYSHGYTYQAHNGTNTVHYMFVCYVLPGESAHKPD